MKRDNDNNKPSRGLDLFEDSVSDTTGDDASLRDPLPHPADTPGDLSGGLELDWGKITPEVTQEPEPKPPLDPPSGFIHRTATQSPPPQLPKSPPQKKGPRQLREAARKAQEQAAKDDVVARATVFLLPIALAAAVYGVYHLATANSRNVCEEIDQLFREVEEEIALQDNMGDPEVRRRIQDMVLDGLDGMEIRDDRLREKVDNTYDLIVTGQEMQASGEPIDYRDAATYTAKLRRSFDALLFECNVNGFKL